MYKYPRSFLLFDFYGTVATDDIHCFAYELLFFGLYFRGQEKHDIKDGILNGFLWSNKIPFVCSFTLGIVN